MPPHLSVPRFLAAHAALGAGIGWGLLGLLLWTDTAGLARLIAADPAAGQVAVAMLLIAFGVSFGATAMGSAVMLLAGDDHGPGGGRKADRAATGCGADASPCPAYAAPSAFCRGRGSWD